mmetsp:Transcript_38931/g.117089  ORF Transcript_38931/g.117089 Transcript_38931/m.117089 type:complete len:223 (+) Transcript_38931:1594-2262(+)
MTLPMLCSVPTLCSASALAQQNRETPVDPVCPSHIPRFLCYSHCYMHLSSVGSHPATLILGLHAVARVVSARPCLPAAWIHGLVQDVAPPSDLIQKKEVATSRRHCHALVRTRPRDLRCCTHCRTRSDPDQTPPSLDCPIVLEPAFQRCGGKTCSRHSGNGLSIRNCSDRRPAPPRRQRFGRGRGCLCCRHSRWCRCSNTARFLRTSGLARPSPSSALLHSG